MNTNCWQQGKNHRRLCDGDCRVPGVYWHATRTEFYPAFIVWLPACDIRRQVDDRVEAALKLMWYQRVNLQIVMPYQVTAIRPSACGNGPSTLSLVGDRLVIV